ncbi:Tim44/TimA family putative adaptor protein [Candidatus Liberibacter brunswickensis]|uniref:Tim44/TimA family putative adaptor protein n=1 Tax=Candidatus Liberibacter brunswickensis TaxID=1968796 RepID=UPI002FE230F1
MDLGDFLILLFAFITIFIFLQLRSVLGKKSTREKPFPDYLNEKKKKFSLSKEDTWNVLSFKKVKKQDILDSVNELFPIGTHLNKTMRDIISICSNFDPKDFLNNARSSYETIVDSFFEGKIHEIEKLVDGKVYQDFNDSLMERKYNEKNVKSSLVGIDDFKIVNASIENNSIYITIRIVGQFISASYDKNDALISSDPEIFGKVIDVWTFTRNVSSDNPNWILISTKPGE